MLESPSAPHSNRIIQDALPPVANLTPRFLLLRTICCLALVSSINTLVNKNVLVRDNILNVFILVHHIAIAFGPRFSLNGLGDLVITAGEIGTLGWIIVTSQIVNGWSTLVQVATATTWWMLLASVALFAMVKIINTIAVKGKNLLRRLDITDPRWMKCVPQNGGDFERSTMSVGQPKKLTAGDVLLGRSPWQAKLIGEHKWMIISRGLFATLSIFIIVTFATYNIIFEPIRESALLPINHLRTSSLSPDTTVSLAVWNVVLWKLSSNASEVNRLATAVQVMRLWNEDSTQSKDSCTHSSRKPVYIDTAVQHTITFYCYPNELRGKHLPIRKTHPDLLVTVNFTSLNIPSDTIGNAVENSVNVMIGFVNKTELVLSNTMPVILIPGMNVFAITNMVVRQQLETPTLSTFGLFTSYHTFYTSEISPLIQDPSPSSLITRSPDVATIRITRQVNRARLRIIQDSRDKSVLRGFSIVGGLWTSLGGIFAVLFGTSLLRVMFNIKPVSVLGLAHSVQKEEIRDSCLKKYPRIPRDLNTSPEERGIISLLSDHLIDLDFLGPRTMTNTLPDTIPLTSTLRHEDVENPQSPLFDDK